MERQVFISLKGSLLFYGPQFLSFEALSIFPLKIAFIDMDIK